MRGLGLAVAVLASSCGGSSTVITAAGGGAGLAGGRGGGGGPGGGAGGGSSTAGGAAGVGGGGGGDGSGCPDDAKTIWVVAQDRTFSAFDARAKTFRDVGTLSCPVTGAAAPFSMAVARDAFAYVLYENGELFKVSTSGLGCTKTSFTPDATYRVFGMGFSSDAPGAATDTLFITGGPMVSAMSKLGRLDVGTFTPTPTADLFGWPELTGTGDAQLWGFFPVGVSTPFVARIDKASGAFTTQFPAAPLAGNPAAWAFAFWGGSFWIFYQRDTEASTRVWEMQKSDGALSTALTSAGRTIVGAGVSTCAPITIN